MQLLQQSFPESCSCCSRLYLPRAPQADEVASDNSYQQHSAGRLKTILGHCSATIAYFPLDVFVTNITTYFLEVHARAIVLFRIDTSGQIRHKIGSYSKPLISVLLQTVIHTLKRNRQVNYCPNVVQNF